jgi:hypothetical protein
MPRGKDVGDRTRRCFHACRRTRAAYLSIVRRLTCPYSAFSSLLAALGLWIFGMVNAYRTAERANQQDFARF